ncbi:hypothetical protein D3C76_742910 [compost metagenome]
MGGVEVQELIGRQLKTALDLYRILLQVIFRFGVLREDSGAIAKGIAQRIKSQGIDFFAGEISHVVGPARLVSRAETVDVAIPRVQSADPVVDIRAQCGGRQNSRHRIIEVQGITAAFLADTDIDLARLPYQMPSQISFHRFGDTVGGLHGVPGFEVTDAGGFIADIQGIGDAIAVVQAQQILVPTGIETEQRRLNPFVPRGPDAIGMVLIPIELAITDRRATVRCKRVGFLRLGTGHHGK